MRRGAEVGPAREMGSLSLKSGQCDWSAFRLCEVLEGSRNRDGLYIEFVLIHGRRRQLPWHDRSRFECWSQQIHIVTVGECMFECLHACHVYEPVTGVGDGKGEQRVAYLLNFGTILVLLLVRHDEGPDVFNVDNMWGLMCTLMRAAAGI
jgi:hypothetical protein